MIYGDIIRIAKSGPRLSPRAVKPLGIHDGSVCWGVEARKPNDAELSPGKLHRIISPIHPDAWPFVFHLQLQLKNAAGTMNRAAQILANNDINILFAECHPSGYAHATWNIVGDALGARMIYKTDEMQNSVREAIKKCNGQANDGNKELLEAVLAIRIAMMQQLRSLENALKVNNEEHAFLHQRPVGREGLFGKLTPCIRAFNDPDAKLLSAEHEKHLDDAITFRLMPTLCYFWLTSVQTGRSRSVELTYNAADGCLGLVQDEDTDFFLKGSSGKAIATFDTEQRFLRLKPLEEDELAHLKSIDASYEARNKNGNEPWVSSKGLLFEMTRPLKEKEIDLVQVRNTLLKRTEDTEAGRVELVSLVSQEAKQELQQAIEGVPTGEGVEIKKPVRVGDYRTERIFVSVHNEFRNSRTVKKELLEVAAEFGFRYSENRRDTEIVFSYSLTKPTVSSVIEDMRQCQGFLQVACFRSPGEFRRGDRSGHEWLIAEYLAAKAVGLATVRLVDDTHYDKEQWKRALVLVEEDMQAIPLSGSAEDRMSAFRHAFRELERGLDNRP